MSSCKSIIVSSEVISDFEVALTKLKLLHSKEHESELDARREELKSGELKLQQDRATFETDCIRFKDALSKFEAAQAELKGGIGQLNIVQTNMEGSMSYLKFEGIKESLKASKMRFEVADEELNVFKDAVKQLEFAIAGGSGTSACLEEELRTTILDMESSELKLKKKLSECDDKSQRYEGDIFDLKRVILDSVNKNGAELEELHKEKISLQAQNSQLSETARKVKNEMLRLEGDLKESRAKIQRMSTDNEQLKNDKEKIKGELKESEAMFQKETESLRFVIANEVKPRNHVVFFDMEIRGVPSGRILIELYDDTAPRIAYIFLLLCTGEMSIPGTDKDVGYKGAEFTDLRIGSYIRGGNIVGVENAAEFYSIYGKISSDEYLKRSDIGRDEVMLTLNYDKDVPHKSYSFSIPVFGNTCIKQIGPVIGRVIQGLNMAKGLCYGLCGGIQEVGTFVIAECGQLHK